MKLVESHDQSILLCQVDTIQNEIEDSDKVVERVVACQKNIQDALAKWKNELSMQKKKQINPSQGLPGVVPTTMHGPALQAKA